MEEYFSEVCGKLSCLLYVKDYNKAKVNCLVDVLNSKSYKTGDVSVRKHDVVALVTALCVNIKPTDEFLAAKTSHLINNVITKENIQFDTEYLSTVISWHVECLRKCSDIILPDILHNMQCILQYHPQAGYKFTEELIGPQGLLINLIRTDKSHMLSTQNSLQICLIALKCITVLVASEDVKSQDQQDIPLDLKENVSQSVVKCLMRGSTKSQDEFLYCKAIISALRVLSQLYFNDQRVTIPLPEVMGICRHFIVYGLVTLDNKPERLMPAQQTIAEAPVVKNLNLKGGKKQRLRKQRNNAIESLKKEIPVCDRSLMKDIDSFENNSAYKPASKNYLEPQKTKNCWALTSDSDMSDVENNREAKLIALKSRVRQSASNLLLVLVKVREKRDIFGYWWALFPDSPNVDQWASEASAKRTLAYCAVTDPIASSRASVLGVVLAVLSGSRMYLSQAEISKKESTSFIPFSETLGYTIACMHKVLTSILDSERSHAVILVALKCCAALVQATPYHKMKEGLITEVVRSTRRFLVHKDITLQVGALITMGCILSVDPKVDEILEAIQKDTVPTKTSHAEDNSNEIDDDECDDFEEGYSDDEMFSVNTQQETVKSDEGENVKHELCFKSWILDICFKHMGWTFRGGTIIRCKPSAIPLILESLQVLSAVSFHHLHDLLKPHLTLLADILSEMLQHEHQDVILQASRTISIIGDAIQKLEHTDQAPSLSHCVYLWDKLLTPLSTVLQSYENPSAKAVVCDCIANIGEKSFKELQRHQQILCCTLLVGSCSDEEATVRAAAVRALAMTVMYRTLRQDIGFVSDCGENILRTLGEPTLVVRSKAAWALGNLSDALVLNLDDPEADEIDDDLLLRLLEVSIRCAGDNDKVKMSATRGLGNLLRLINNEVLLRYPQIKALCEPAVQKLLDCACKVSNMKVRWNACYAMGNAMRNDTLFTGFSGWQRQVFPSLCSLALECKNLKVRINAASALRAPAIREHYGEHYATVWRGVMMAMENATNIDDFTEYKHKDNLIEQLCVTLAHLCCILKKSDLTDIMDPLIFHRDCAKALYTQMCHKLPPENASCLKILQAAKYVTVDLTASSETQSQALGMLQDIFIWGM